MGEGDLLEKSTLYKCNNRKVDFTKMLQFLGTSKYKCFQFLKGKKVSGLQTASFPFIIDRQAHT